MGNLSFFVGLFQISVGLHGICEDLVVLRNSHQTFKDELMVMVLKVAVMFDIGTNEWQARDFLRRSSSISNQLSSSGIRWICFETYGSLLPRQ